jgi:uncharacterized protein (TIGR03435 family)
MLNRSTVRLNAGRRVLLAMAGLSVAFAPFAGRAQPVDTVARKFEVASVKPCLVEPDTGNQRRQEYRAQAGRVEIECITLERIIFFAYAGIGSMDNPLLNDHPADTSHVRGGPGWIRSEKFTIDAKAEGTAERQIMMGPMLRALLEERFRLKLHRETEEIPMYALTVAKGGIKMNPIDADGCLAANPSRNSSDGPPRPDPAAKPVCGSFRSTGDGVNKHWLLGGETLDRFANSTLSSVLDRFVMNQTADPRRFNISLNSASMTASSPACSGAAARSIRRRREWTRHPQYSRRCRSSSA